MGDENLAKIVFTNHFYNLFYALRVEFIEYIVKQENGKMAFSFIFEKYKLCQLQGNYKCLVLTL